MADMMHVEPGSDERFTIDKAYLVRQADEALATFFAPLSGIYRAATGRPNYRISRRMLRRNRRRRAA